MSSKSQRPVLAVTSILFAVACGGSPAASCPSDPPAMACMPSDKCCTEATAYQSCVGRNVPTICGSDGKADTKVAEQLCPKETAEALACALTGGETCANFAMRPFSFSTQPAGLSAEESGTASIATGEVPLGYSVRCEVVDGAGSVVADKCAWGGLLVPGSLSYGPLPAGTYKLNATASFRDCPVRTISSSSFQVGSSLAGTWTGSKPGNESTLSYTYAFKPGSIMTFTRVAQQDGNASLFPGCRIERIVQATWQVSGSQLKLVASSGTVERARCKYSSDLVTPPADYGSADLDDFSSSNSGSFVLSMSSPRTLTLTSTESPPVLTLQ